MQPRVVAPITGVRETLIIVAPNLVKAIPQNPNPTVPNPNPKFFMIIKT